MLYLLLLSKKKIQPRWPANLDPPLWDLTPQDPASDVTKQDTGLSPDQAPGHPPNPATPANNGATGKWIDCPQMLPTKSQGPPQAQQQWVRGQTLGGPGIPDHGS